MIFRPSDACFDDENRNYYALDGSWHQYSQDCFQANVKWLNEEIPYIKELEAELYHLRHERDQVVKDLLDYEAIGLKPEEIKEILNAVNGGLAAKNGIWCPKCGDALDIDIVNGVLAIGCFGCGEYTPVSELMKLHLNDAVPVVRCKDCIKWEADESYEFDDDGTKKLWVDCSNSLHHCNPPKPHTTCKDCVHRHKKECPFSHIECDVTGDSIFWHTNKQDDFYCKEAQDIGLATKRK